MRILLVLVLLATTISAISTYARGSVIYVKWNAGGANKGSSWSNAYSDLQNGDQFGARARPDGTVELYRNGTLIGSRSVTSWPSYANGDYIGLWMVNAPGALLDNFGGGTR